MSSLAIKRLVSASVLATAVGVANAQESSSGENDESVQETVIITGSRIPRDPNLGAPVPVQSIDAEAIISSGEFSLVDVIDQHVVWFESRHIGVLWNERVLFIYW